MEYNRIEPNLIELKEGGDTMKVGLIAVKGKPEDIIRQLESIDPEKFEAYKKRVLKGG